MQQCCVCEVVVQGERLSASDAAATMFCTEFLKYIREKYLKLDQIYNASECGFSGKAYEQEPLNLKGKCVNHLRTS
jgi:hypothetical protein